MPAGIIQPALPEIDAHSALSFQAHPCQKVYLRKRIVLGGHVIGSEFSPNGIANTQIMIPWIVTHVFF